MIYIVTYGAYSGYGIVGATTDRSIAEQLADKFKDESWEGCRIEKFPDAEIMLKPAWTVGFGTTGNVVDCDPCEYAYKYRELDEVEEYGRYNRVHIRIRVLAETAEDAIKIAAEKRAKYLAEKLGL